MPTHPTPTPQEAKPQPPTARHNHPPLTRHLPLPSQHRAFIWPKSEGGLAYNYTIASLKRRWATLLSDHLEPLVSEEDILEEARSHNLTTAAAAAAAAGQAKEKQHSARRQLLPTDGKGQEGSQQPREGFARRRLTPLVTLQQLQVMRQQQGGQQAAGGAEEQQEVVDGEGSAGSSTSSRGSTLGDVSMDVAQQQVQQEQQQQQHGATSLLREQCSRLWLCMQHCWRSLMGLLPQGIASWQGSSAAVHSGVRQVWVETGPKESVWYDEGLVVPWYWAKEAGSQQAGAGADSS